MTRATTRQYRYLAGMARRLREASGSGILAWDDAAEGEAELVLEELRHRCGPGATPDELWLALGGLLRQSDGLPEAQALAGRVPRDSGRGRRLVNQIGDHLFPRRPHHARPVWPGPTSPLPAALLPPGPVQPDDEGRRLCRWHRQRGRAQQAEGGG